MCPRARRRRRGRSASEAGGPDRALLRDGGPRAGGADAVLDASAASEKGDEEAGEEEAGADRAAADGARHRRKASEGEAASARRETEGAAEESTAPAGACTGADLDRAAVARRGARSRPVA